MNETLYQSIVLTVVGMAIVFAFMGLLIVLVNAFVAIATKFFPDREPEEIVVQASDSKTDDRVIAAIAGAIKAKE